MDREPGGWQKARPGAYRRSIAALRTGRGRIEKACEASLRRLKTDRLDLYLLYRRGSVPLEETIEGMDALTKAGKIRRWGGSNFDHAEMEQLLRAGG